MGSDELLRIAPNRYAYARYMARARAQAYAMSANMTRAWFRQRPRTDEEKLSDRVTVLTTARGIVRESYRRYLAEYDEYVGGVALPHRSQR